MVAVMKLASVPANIARALIAGLEHDIPADDRRLRHRLA